MSGVIEHEAEGGNFTASHRTRSSTNPAKTYGTGGGFVRHSIPYTFLGR